MARHFSRLLEPPTKTFISACGRFDPFQFVPQSVECENPGRKTAVQRGAGGDVEVAVDHEQVGG